MREGGIEDTDGKAMYLAEWVKWLTTVHEVLGSTYRPGKSECERSVSASCHTKLGLIINPLLIWF